MSADADADPIPLDALLEHQAFVRGLARRLLGDEHAADDLAQETWADLLVNPPRAVRSVRAWLAQSTRHRASNARRAAARRAQHELHTARDEARTEPDVVERVELESRVVQAVLALREPYRTVMLGRYYEGLSTKALAARQGVLESSVRSQEARALEMLRAKLDQTFDGGREAWGLALAGWLSSTKGSSAPLAAWMAGAGLAAAACALVWFTLRAPEPSAPAPIASGPAAAAGGVESTVSHLEAEPIERPAAQARVTSGPASAARPDFHTAPIDELLVLGQQLQRELRTRLLTPDPVLVARYAERDSAEYGVVRVLERTLFGAMMSKHVDALGIREGGSCFSITTREHSFDELPTFGLEGGDFKVCGEGGFLAVGKTRIEDLPDRADEVPRGVEPDAWRALWTEVAGATASERTASFSAGVASHLAHSVPARVGETHLVRAFGDTDFDVLAAVRVLTADDHGVTIAWRRIHTWPVAPRAWERYTAPPLPNLPAAPKWLAELDVPALLALQGELRSATAPRLLAPRGEFTEAERVGIASGEARATCLLKPLLYDALLDVGGSGAWVDFDTGDRTMTPGTSVFLGGGSFRSGGWGSSFGVVLDLGEVGLDEVARYGEHAPEHFDPALRAQWEFAWSVRGPTDAEGHSRRVSTADQVRVGELGLQLGAPAREGHTYLARVIPADANRADAIVVFRDVHADGDGHTIVWRVLERFPLERAERR
ncbi:MAG: sigma-70 family RNA polymerase sigma factor [Planctomycetes bacterium]|nr:sigma-70 family RNA polymerase sigma factor [Planctomycetota bacterium]